MTPWLIESPIYTNDLMNFENLSDGLNLQVIQPRDSDKFSKFMNGDSMSQGFIFCTQAIGADCPELYSLY